MKIQNAEDRKFYERINILRERDWAGYLAVVSLINVCIMEQDGSRERVQEGDFVGATKGELKRAIRKLRKLTDSSNKDVVDKTIDYIRRQHLGRCGATA